MPLALILIFASAIFVRGNDAPSYTFGAAPGAVTHRGTDLVIGFNLRKEGEMAGVAYFVFSETSPWRAYFEKLISTNDFQWTYYSIETRQDPPRARLGILTIGNPVTKETLEDMRKNSEYRRSAGLDNVESAAETMILSIKQISQNEFLNVNPKIVPDPTKTK